MNTALIVFALASALSTSLALAPTAHSETFDERQQQIEKELNAENLLVTLHYAETDGELEPCLNADVSPNGAYPSAELESAVEQLATGELTELLAKSAYFRAFNDGRVTLTR